MHRIKIIILLIFCVACNIENNTPGKINTYYRIDSVLNIQEKLLIDHNPKLVKVAKVDDKKDSVTISLNKDGWANELEIFQDISINKPALRDSYIKDTVKSDSGRWIQYDVKPGLSDEVEIEMMQVFFNNNDDLRKVKTIYKEKGTLYDARREMEIVFEGKPARLKGYKVQGFQKMILKDTTFYFVNAKIYYN
jgi:hypothetical protein